MNKHIARLFALLLIISFSSQTGLSGFDTRTFGVKEGEIYEYELTRLRKNGEVVNKGIFLNTNWDDSYINEGESVKITIDKVTISDSFFFAYDRINITIEYKGQIVQDVVGGEYYIHFLMVGLELVLHPN